MKRLLGQMSYESLGGSIHKLMNETLIRKLTLKEYKRLVELTGELFKRAQSNRTDI